MKWIDKNVKKPDSYDNLYYWSFNYPLNVTRWRGGSAQYDFDYWCHSVEEPELPEVAAAAKEFIKLYDKLFPDSFSFHSNQMMEQWGRPAALAVYRELTKT